ncbi:hypothetical protein HMPREF3190_00796 [Umbribacter vaginalis]|nr:hypothetical protein HMPREF3190_00796 [Coriobacteriales bacterium DNF00809]
MCVYIFPVKRSIRARSCSLPVSVTCVCVYLLLYVLFDTGISTHYGRNFQVQLEFNAQTRMHIVVHVVVCV